MSVRRMPDRKKWVHLCHCGHSWDSWLQADNCWICSLVSHSKLTVLHRDAAEQQMVTGEVPLALQTDAGASQTTLTVKDTES